MRFSVIVPTYNRSLLLSRCMKSLLNQNYSKNDYEIIICDDGSTDNTGDIVSSFKKIHSNIRYYKIKNSGPATARNIGLKRAKGKIIVFTDDDCAAEKSWLKNIELAFKKHNAEGVGGSIINPTNRYIAWSQYILNFSSWLPKGKEKYVRVVPTCNAAYKSSAIKNNPFPTYLKKGGYSDAVFCHELYKKGKKILFQPSIKVKHCRWDYDCSFKTFFDIQKKAAVGFVLGGYKVHGKIGKILADFKLLNLLCPRLVMVFIRCLKYGYILRFVLCLPLIFLGELYRGIVICSVKKY